MHNSIDPWGWDSTHVLCSIRYFEFIYDAIQNSGSRPYTKVFDLQPASLTLDCAKTDRENTKRCLSVEVAACCISMQMHPASHIGLTLCTGHSVVGLPKTWSKSEVPSGETLGFICGFAFMFSMPSEIWQKHFN